MKLSGLLRTIALGAVVFVVINWARGIRPHHLAGDLIRLELTLLGVWAGWLALAVAAWWCSGESQRSDRGSTKTNDPGPGSNRELPSAPSDLSSLFPPLRRTREPQAFDYGFSNNLGLPLIPACGHSRESGNPFSKS